MGRGETQFWPEIPSPDSPPCSPRQPIAILIEAVQPPAHTEWPPRPFRTSHLLMSWVGGCGVQDKAVSGGETLTRQSDSGRGGGLQRAEVPGPRQQREK